MAIMHHKIAIKKNMTKNSGTQKNEMLLFWQDRGKNGENNKTTTLPPRKPAISTYNGLKKLEKSTGFIGRCLPLPKSK